MRRRNSLIGQILATNTLLITGALFAATAAAGLDLAFDDERLRFLLFALVVALVLALNTLILRRRFSPLEQLIGRVEAIDPAHPAGFVAPEGGAVEEIDRLSRSFRRLLERIEEERRRSGALVLRAQEEERKRLARDLHDEVNQALTAMLLRLSAVSQDAPAGLAAELAEIRLLANGAMRELIQLARQLRPAALDDHGLVPALEGQVRRFSEHTGIEVGLSMDQSAASLPEDRQTVVYRVAQEALNNVARHSGAGRVDLALGPANGVLELRVRDDGQGFELDGVELGLGLNGMAERARLVGGSLSVDSRPGAGTSVVLEVPRC